jgi:hypothetical protein
MNGLNLYRRRFIPDELVHLKDDIILARDEKIIITKWKTLHPRKDIAGGISAYYIDLGLKISRIFDKDHRHVYWYCDIVQAKEGPDPDTLIFEDLLIDVILHPDGTMRIMDLVELADALELKLITEADTRKALHSLDTLLSIIYHDEFHTLTEPVCRAGEKYII